MEKLIAAARDAKVPVIYSITAQAEPKDIATALTPKEGDPIVKSGPDKFVKTDLADILTKKGIKYKELITAAETAKVPEVKVKKWIPRWVGKGYITAE